MSPSCYLSCVPNFSFSSLVGILSSRSCALVHGGFIVIFLKKNLANDQMPYMHWTILHMLFLYCKHLSFQLWSLFRFLNINGAGEGKLLFPWNYFNGYNSTSRGGTHTGSSRWAPDPGGELFIVFQRPAPLQFCFFSFWVLGFYSTFMLLLPLLLGQLVWSRQLFFFGHGKTFFKK